MNLFLDLFLTFFRIGAFTFGGGYAMLPMVEQEVIAHQWMSMDELVNFIAVSESTPGSFAVNVSTYIGTVTGGFFGAVCATLGVVTPSFLIILIVAKSYEAFRKSAAVQGVMAGLRPAVVGLIGSALISVGKTVFFPDASLKWNQFLMSAGIFVLSVYLIRKKKISPIPVILIGALIGIVAGYGGILA
ncbi:MAG: chromate transporter [Bulleidia sp.]